MISAIFGICLVCSGTVLFLGYMNYRWKQSDMKAREEYMLFRKHMRALDIENETITATIKGIKSIKELKQANDRLKKCIK